MKTDRHDSNWGGARPGSGAKPKFAKRRPIMIGLEESERNALKAYCDEREVPMSNFVRGIILKLLDLDPIDK